VAVGSVAGAGVRKGEAMAGCYSLPVIDFHAYIVVQEGY
jgi:hypothetical protein